MLVNEWDALAPLCTSAVRMFYYKAFPCITEDTERGFWGSPARGKLGHGRGHPRLPGPGDSGAAGGQTPPRGGGSAEGGAPRARRGGRGRGADSPARSAPTMPL